MSYNKNIPLASSRLRDSQSDLLENFKCIDALLGANHVISPWTSPVTGDEGKHKFLQLPNRSNDVPPVDPSGSVGAGEVGIYCKNDGSAVQQLYLKNGSADEIAITSATLASTGETTLPSGLKIKWGRGATDASGDATITFANAFSSAVYSIQTTVAVESGDKSSSSVYDMYTRVWQFSKTKFEVVSFQLNVSRTRSATNFHWYAVGK